MAIPVHAPHMMHITRPLFRKRPVTGSLALPLAEPGPIHMTIQNPAGRTVLPPHGPTGSAALRTASPHDPPLDNWDNEGGAAWWEPRSEDNAAWAPCAAGGRKDS